MPTMLSTPVTPLNVPLLEPARVSHFIVRFSEGDDRIGASVTQCSLPHLRITPNYTAMLSSQRELNTFTFEIQLDATNIIAPWLSKHVVEKLDVAIDLVDDKGNTHVRYEIKGARFNQIIMSVLDVSCADPLLAAVEVAYDSFVFGGAST